MIYGILTNKTLSISLKLMKGEIFVLLTNVCSYRTLGITSSKLDEPEYLTKHTKPNNYKILFIIRKPLPQAKGTAQIKCM